MSNIKNQSYLFIPGNINCDSTNGVMISKRICANLELQRQDSLLSLVMEKILGDVHQPGYSDTLDALYHQHDQWQESMCKSCERKCEGSLDAILFMRCMALFIKQRREMLNALYSK